MYTNVRICDSCATMKEYARRAQDLGHGILSTCEHGWQGNYYEAFKIAHESNLKLVIGAEAYWVKDRFEKDGSNCHIYIGAKNENGRQALNDALSEANLTGFYRQPRLDIPLILALPKDDVIVTSACIAGWRYDDADSIMCTLHDHFRNNFFLEVQYHNVLTQIELNKRILKLHEDHKIPLIMGCDSHFIYPNQKQNRDDFLASKGMVYEDEADWQLDYPDGDTAYSRFADQCVLSHQQIVDAIDNTNIFLDVEEYNSDIFSDDLKLPTLYPNLTQDEKDEIYKKLVWDGWDKYKNGVDNSLWPKYESEINSEIQTVIDTHMADYFIIDYEVMKRGKEKGGHLTKSGRGSGASFFTNTLLGFSDIDRISASVHMYPERFMSTTRILQSKGIPD